MSDEDFLTRWSRRKRAAEDEGKAAPEAKAEPRADSDKAEPVAALPEEELDLASLPPIESITDLTDVTVFLRKGVPADLARAALRRAWTADPAIRDFIGLSENAWDFNDPNGIPGFGPLEQSAEEVRKLVSQVFGDVRRAVEEVSAAPEDVAPATDTASESVDQTIMRVEHDVMLPVQEADDSAHSDSAELRDRDATISASQQTEQRDVAQLPRRSHGGALPH